MKIYRNIISVISFALSIYILILNLFCTCFTTADRFQMNYFSGDIVIFNLINTQLFMPTGYMDIYPNQYGLTLLSYLASFAVGTYNYTFFRLVNVLFLVLLYNELSLTGKQIGLGKTSQLLILLTGIFFMPSTLYALYIYGNIASLALSVMAVRIYRTGVRKE